MWLYVVLLFLFVGTSGAVIMFVPELMRKGSKEAPPEEPKWVVPLKDKLEALKFLIANREKFEERCQRYPQEMMTGKYRCVMDYNTGPDHYINKIWDEL